MSKIAIFGGTFDPVHWGHLLLAETAFDQFHLDRVIWVPTLRPSYKAPPLLAFEHRLEMVRRAIAAHPGFTVSAVNGQSSDRSYAIETFNLLQALEPNALWHWIVGNDAFQSLPKWQDSHVLMKQCLWLVAPRVLEGEGREERREGRGEQKEEPSFPDGQPMEISIQEDQSTLKNLRALTSSPPHPLTPLPPHLSTLSPHLRWYPLQMPSVAISSSLIRSRCREGRSIRYLVPEAVHSYIVGQNLYQMS
ncbi:MAG: nicotinate (nicotinamide) nucleotide adenylyltransferase [Tildeniella nuda ZEHNDER 1965/U140]|jgi:nicotinate-nucleotide adenylyltransferase|nr:nicotinate (nicotinamide) nucleotide adenylyltransferase [Tildeniella nuda ZEHNDER 1965/U140]